MQAHSTTPWMLVQYVDSSGDVGRAALLNPAGAVGRPPAGRHPADTLVELPPGLPGTSVLDLLCKWEIASSILREFAPQSARAVAAAGLIAPVTFPGVVLGAGANYFSHCKEMGVGIPDPHADAFFFMKPPATTVIGPSADIPYPLDPETMLDWEAELGVVIGTLAKDVPVERAREHIAGYVVANDLSARNRTARTGAASPHFVYDWLGQKGQDGFCPIGPGVTPSWLVADPQQLRLRLWVNDELKQDESTADMVITVEQLVAAASRTMTLHPGDVILTGTPAGVGVPRAEFLAPGDTVTVTIDGLGTISNTVVAPDAIVASNRIATR